MRQLAFDDFVICFRKQFIFQTGRGGRRLSKYYTNYSLEEGRKRDSHRALMVFIYTGKRYGYTANQMLSELKIRDSLYDVLHDEVHKIVAKGYPDKELCRKIKIKIGLVENAVYYTHKIKANKLCYANVETQKW